MPVERKKQQHTMEKCYFQAEQGRSHPPVTNFKKKRLRKKCSNLRFDLIYLEFSLLEN